MRNKKNLVPIRVTTKRPDGIYTHNMPMYGYVWAYDKDGKRYQVREEDIKNGKAIIWRKKQQSNIIKYENPFDGILPTPVKKSKKETLTRLPIIQDNRQNLLIPAKEKIKQRKDKWKKLPKNVEDDIKRAITEKRKRQAVIDKVREIISKGNREKLILEGKRKVESKKRTQKTHKSVQTLRSQLKR